MINDYLNQLQVLGYDDKINVLTKKLIETIKSLEIKPDRFKLIKEQLTRAYKNWFMEQPYQHASYFATHVFQETLWTSAEKLEVIEGF